MWGNVGWFVPRGLRQRRGVMLGWGETGPKGGASLPLSLKHTQARHLRYISRQDEYSEAPLPYSFMGWCYMYEYAHVIRRFGEKDKKGGHFYLGAFPWDMEGGSGKSSKPRLRV